MKKSENNNLELIGHKSLKENIDPFQCVVQEIFFPHKMMWDAPKGTGLVIHLSTCSK